MKLLHKLFRPCLVLVLVLGLCLVGSSPLLAQPNVAAESVPSNSNPLTGATITVDINIDMSGSPAPDDKLGSFTGTLDWNPAVLSFVSQSGLKAGFTGVVNTTNTATGKLSFNGANPSGAGGKSNVLTITYTVVGSNGSSTVLDLAFSAMSAALTFKNLVPILTVTDGRVTVGGGGQQNVVARAVCPTSDPAPQSTITIPLFVNMTGSPAPDDKLGSFTGTLEWNPAILTYASNSGLKSGFTGVVNTGSTGTGKLSYNGANPTGAGGDVNILDVTFSVTGADSQTSKVDLEFSAMSAALTFKNLISNLTINDCSIHVKGEQPTQCVPRNCTGAAIFPVAAGRTAVGDTIFGRDATTICVDIRLKENPGPIDAFGFTVKVNPAHLAFSSASAGNLTTGWQFIGGQETPPGSGTIICGGSNPTGIPANSAGVLIRLCFRVTCQRNQTSEITIINPSDDVANFATCCNIFKCAVCISDGDVNGDTRLTAGDALCAFRIFLNGGNLSTDCDAPNFTCELAAADPNCDGRVTPGDALAIFQRGQQGQPPLECFARSPQPQFRLQSAPYQLALTHRTTTPSGQAGNNEIVKVTLSVENPRGLNAFGATLSYPADQLDFIGVQRADLTANWMEIDGRQNLPGTITIGGFNRQALTTTGPGELFAVLFAAKGELTSPPDFGLSNLVDNFSNAAVKVADFGRPGVSAIPQAFKLHQNFPNPFQATTPGSTTLIRVDLPGTKTVRVELAVYNLTGQLVRQLIYGTQSPGIYEVTWDGKDEQGWQVPSGTYVYRLKAGNFAETKRLTIIR